MNHVDYLATKASEDTQRIMHAYEKTHPLEPTWFDTIKQFLIGIIGAWVVVCIISVIGLIYTLNFSGYFTKDQIGWFLIGVPLLLIWFFALKVFIKSYLLTFAICLFVVLGLVYITH